MLMLPLHPIPHADVSWDFTAELYSPPYLSAGPRPAITSTAISSADLKRLRPGKAITVGYKSKNPVTRALLIRTAPNTHSLSFGERSGQAVWEQLR
jgi:hypothetical protein